MLIDVIKKIKILPYLLLFGQQFEAEMESSTGFTGELTGLFGFQKKRGNQYLRKGKIT